jgi:branched-chain amino acid transport system permease protein
MPILLDVALVDGAALLGLNLAPGITSMAQLVVFGALIIFFLIVEPHGLARLWQIAKEKLRLWPFPH